MFNSSIESSPSRVGGEAYLEMRHDGAGMISKPKTRESAAFFTI